MRDFKTPFDADMLKGLQNGVLRYQYKGIPCLKNPIDVAIYMRLLWVEKPKTIIEIGTKFGGSALLFSDLIKMMALDCEIISIDINISLVSNLKITNVRFLEGDIHRLDDVFKMEGLYHLPRPWLIIEDSAHTYQACLDALGFFGQILEQGEMLVMEDGILSELGLEDKYSGGPNRAIEDFMKKKPGVFDVDLLYCDMFGTNATFNPNGYLRKK